MRLLIVGGSDAGISAALRARELDQNAEIAVLLERRFPQLQHLWFAFLLER